MDHVQDYRVGKVLWKNVISEQLCNPLGFPLNGRTVTILFFQTPGNFLCMLQQSSGNGKMRNKSIALYTFMLTVSHSRYVSCELVSADNLSSYNS